MVAIKILRAKEEEENVNSVARGHSKSAAFLPKSPS